MQVKLRLVVIKAHLTQQFMTWWQVLRLKVLVVKVKVCKTKIKIQVQHFSDGAIKLPNK